MPSAVELRHCAKIALAAVAAYLLTLGEQSSFAIFSVMGAALVMGGTIGESLTTSLNRVRGTIAGTAVGVAFAYPFGLSVGSLAAAVAVLAWLCSGFGWGAAAIRVGIAMVLVVLFTHSADAAQYGGWRLLNTVIGVVVGIVVNRLVWPIRGRDEIARAVDKALAAIADTLDALARDAAPDALLPLQSRMLDAITEVRTARRNARLERKVDPATDLLTDRTRLAMRATISTLAASLTLEELLLSAGKVECADAVRRFIAAIAARARPPVASDGGSDDLGSLYERAASEAKDAGFSAEQHAYLATVLGELHRAGMALEALSGTRDGRR